MERAAIIRSIGQLNMVLDEYRTSLSQEEADAIHSAIRVLQKVYKRT